MPRDVTRGLPVLAVMPTVAIGCWWLATTALVMNSDNAAVAVNARHAAAWLVASQFLLLALVPALTGPGGRVRTVELMTCVAAAWPLIVLLWLAGEFASLPLLLTQVLLLALAPAVARLAGWVQARHVLREWRVVIGLACLLLASASLAVFENWSLT